MSGSTGPAKGVIYAVEAIFTNPGVSGQVFLITNGEPVLLWDFVDIILQTSGLEPLKKRVPAWAAIMISHIAEAFNRILLNEKETITPFIVSELTRSHWFDISRARRLLDYEPVISNSEGLKRIKSCLQS